MVPVAALAYHYGPGQEHMRLDAVGAVLRQADRLAANKVWSAAVAKYEEALRLLPTGHGDEAWRIRLERAKCQMLAKKLPEANADLFALLEEMKDNPSADPKLVAQAREALASSQYYMTWLMRLEGFAREAWEPEIEGARQHYKLLAEQADAAGDTAGARKHREDLESAVRLARMDLGELQGLPLPSQ